jgi:hypothetical protein
MFKFIFFLLLLIYGFFSLKRFLKSFYLKKPNIIFSGILVLQVKNSRNYSFKEYIQKVGNSEYFRIELINEIENYFIFSEKKSPIFEKPILYLMSLENNQVLIYSKTYGLPLLRAVAIPRSDINYITRIIAD